MFEGVRRQLGSFTDGVRRSVVQQYYLDQIQPPEPPEAEVERRLAEMKGPAVLLAYKARRRAEFAKDEAELYRDSLYGLRKQGWNALAGFAMQAPDQIVELPDANEPIVAN